MIAHQITLEWSDGAAELLALDFTTGRVIVRWGSAPVDHVGAYRFDRETSTWRRESVPHGYRVAALAGPAGDSRCRDLGPMHDDSLTARPVFDELAIASSWLRKHTKTCRYFARARCVASWLLGMRATLANANGLDLLDTLAQRDALGGVEVDDILGELVRCQVIYPHALMPRGDAIITHDTHANMRACFRGRFVLDSHPSVWAEHTAGAKHWIYQCGPSWEVCTGVRAGYQGK